MGQIYAIRCAETRRIKIGFTNKNDGWHSVEARRRSLQCGSPTQLLVAAWAPATRDIEQAAHAILRHHRLHGEWLVPHADVLDVVDVLHGNDPTTNAGQAILEMCKEEVD